MTAVVLSGVVVIANVAGAGMILPQVLRLRRSSSVDGISPTWVGVGIALNSWWVLYAIGSGVLAIAPVAFGGATFYTVIAVEYARITGRRLEPALATGLVVATSGPLLAWAVGGWSTVGIVLGLSYGIQFAPAVATAVRASSVAAVSTGTWGLAWIEAVGWLVYGLAIMDAALILGGTGGGIMSATILWCVTRQRRTEAPTFAVVG